MCSFAGLFSLLDSRSEPTLADLLKVDMLLIRRVDGLIGVCNRSGIHTKCLNGWLLFKD